MSEMQAKLNHLDNSQVRASIDVTNIYVNKAYDHAFKTLAQQIKWKGFRPGKVPRNIIERHYPDSVKQEAIEWLIANALSDCIKQNELRTVGKPDVLNLEKLLNALRPDVAIQFEAVLEKFPSTNLQGYQAILVTAPDYYHNEQHLNTYLKELQQKHGRMERLSKDSVVTNKSIVQIQYAFYLIDDNTDKHHLYNLNLDHPDPWFGSIQEKLIELKRGDKVHFDIQIPRDYTDITLQGKQGHVWIKILSISEIILPTIDDDFAKDLYYASLDELKKEVEKHYIEFATKKKKEFVWNILFQKIKENAKFEIGPQFIESELQYQMQQMKDKFKEMKINFENYLKESQETIESVQEKTKLRVINEIQYYLIRETIIKEEKIEASQSDIQDEIEYHADQYKMSVEEFKKKIIKSTDHLEQINQNCVDAKLYERLIQLNNIQTGAKELLPNS